MIKVKLKDGSIREYESGTLCSQVAADISEGLLRTALAVTVDGEVHGLDYPLTSDCEVSFLTFEDEGGRLAFRHTASHVLAQAIKRLYPDTKLAIGPAIADGFYYDVDSETVFTPQVLEELEGEMKKIIKENLKLERFELPRQEAL